MKLFVMSHVLDAKQRICYSKNIILVLSMLLLSLAIASCSDNEKEQTIEVPAGMVVCDLSKFGKQFSIFIPDTSNSKLEIVEQSWGALEIKVGKEFHISVTEDPGDIELRKSDIKSNDVNVFKSYLTEEPLCILWESQIIKPEYHFYAIKNNGETSYVFEDVVPLDGNPLSKEAIQKMVFSAKNIIENKKRHN
jgi:hypothetical protein